jgi:hypothetical protein
MQFRPFSARVTIIIALLLTAVPALATAPAPEPEVLSPAEMEAWLAGGSGGPREVPPPLGPFNYLREFDQMVGFLADWQVSDPDSSDYGGMIEAESGYLGGVIQTDNTLEAIWCWSRYWEFSGRDTYSPNIDAAWVYCLRFPAWAEEGAAGDDYYRVHNCAWGLTTVLRYEAVTGDLSHHAYAETCAAYIVAHPLTIDGTVYAQRLDAFCKGWAAGNLYLYGEAVGNAAYRTAAVTQGNDVKNWLQTNPVVNMAAEYWAMSSGTSVWGVCNSVFRNDPAGGMAWCATYAPYMDTWQDWLNVPGYDWDVAWNVAYLNAHFAVWDVTNDDDYFANGVFLTDALLSYDTDDDGGIISSTVDPVTEDMSWVSCYLIKFGVDRLMLSPLTHDVGLLRFADWEDGLHLSVGVPLDLRVIPTNYGLSDEVAVPVVLSGDAGNLTVYHDMPFAALDTLTLIQDWLPASGTYTLTVATALPGDPNSSNDALSITVYVGEETDAPAGLAAGAAHLTRNPFTETTALRFALVTEGSARLEIFDVAGRLVRALDAGQLAAGEHRLAWDGRDASGQPVPAGLYLYRLSTNEGAHAGKVMRLR